MIFPHRPADFPIVRLSGRRNSIGDGRECPGIPGTFFYDNSFFSSGSLDEYAGAAVLSVDFLIERDGCEFYNFLGCFFTKATRQWAGGIEDFR